MTPSPAIIGEADMEKLDRLVRGLRHSLFRDRQQLESLERILQDAEIRPQARVPRDVIGMNCTIRVLDFDTEIRQSYTLVCPESADILAGRLSVLAPLGMSVLGRRKGDVVEVHVPGGVRKVKVEQVSPARTKIASSAPQRRVTRLDGSDEMLATA